MANFEDFKLNKQLLLAVEAAGYTQPSEIQIKAIPQIIAGHDVLGIAQTGTGKTAAYLLPLFMKVKYAQMPHPRGLVLVPTRELAIQVAEQAKKLAQFTDLRITVLYGGIGPKTQIEQVEAGTDIVIATPGRFMDIYLSGKLIVKHLNTLVLDEADKMMDMGFMPQIRKILEFIPRKRQNLLFSATFPPKVEMLSQEFLDFPMRIEVTPESTPVNLVSQSLFEVPNFLTKINLLGYLLQNADLSRVIVFVRTKTNAENIYKYLSRKVEKNVRVIHANKGQNSRINAMEEFKDGAVRVLVATDVAARGIDVSHVSHVINFDIPLIYEDYVHRIGRTGRAGNTGTSISFANMAEIYHVGKIEKMIKMKIPKSPLPSDLGIEETSFDERQEMLREIDLQKRKEDPDFLGAFHEKKNIPTSSKTRSKKKSAGPKSSGTKFKKSAPKRSTKSGPSSKFKSNNRNTSKSTGSTRKKSR